VIKYENAAILQRRENQHNMIKIYINYAKTTQAMVHNEIQKSNQHIWGVSKGGTTGFISPKILQ